MAHNDLTLLGADLASAVRSQPTCRVRWGVVTATDGHTCSVQLGGVETAIDGIRYLSSYGPVVGETVALLYDGADIFVIGALADYDTGWIDVTPASGITGTYKVRRVGKTVTVTWYCTSALTQGTATTLCTLPVGFRPTMTTPAACKGATTNVYHGTANSDGTVVVVNTSTSTGAHFGSATYLV